jgi:hypothetical protein
MKGKRTRRHRRRRHTNTNFQVLHNTESKKRAKSCDKKSRSAHLPHPNTDTNKAYSRTKRNILMESEFSAPCSCPKQHHIAYNSRTHTLKFNFFFFLLSTVRDADFKCTRRSHFFLFVYFLVFPSIKKTTHDDSKPVRHYPSRQTHVFHSFGSAPYFFAPNLEPVKSFFFHFGAWLRIKSADKQSTVWLMQYCCV